MNQDAAAAAAVALLGILCLILIVAIVIAIFYLLTLQKALSRVSPRNRLMEPGMVWLSLIPLFNIIWAFFIATRIPDSLRNEFRDRGQDAGSDYAKRIGLTNAILGVVSIPLNAFSRLFKNEPGLGIILGLIMMILGLVSLVLFIIFWVRIAGYSKELAALPSYPDSGPDYDDRADNRDRGPRGPSSDAIRPADPGAFRPEDRDRY